jgi:hypothetical protein
VLWEIEGTDQFGEWYGSLSAFDQERIDFVIGLLEARGPALKRPYADTVNESKFPNMKELRAQSGGEPLRIFFAFDPRRIGLLLIGGNKGGDDRFYKQMITIADSLYSEHLSHLKSEHNA